MSYWMLVLSPARRAASLDRISDMLSSNCEASFEVVAGTEEDWTELSLHYFPDDQPQGWTPDADDHFATIHRRVVEPDDEEITEMIEDLDDAGIEPVAGARRVAAYLPGVRCVYSASPKNRVRHGEALEAVRYALLGIQGDVGGLLYCDLEGYSNEHGDQVTWELFDRPHTGLWWVALPDEEGGWLRFQIDLADADHCAAFRAGRVPEGLRAERVA